MIKERILLILIIIFFGTSNLVFGESQEKLSNCGVTPSFAMKIGFSNPIFSTRDRFKPGMVMFKILPTGNFDSPFQLPSWSAGGRLGSFVVDEIGDIFVVPSPSVNTLLNPPERQNWLYWINSKNGVLEPFIKLEVEKHPSQTNPYGLLGITYDCQSKIIYLSTVTGSTQEQVVGQILAVSKIERKIISRYTGIDALSLGVFKEAEGKKLYVGLARESKIQKLSLVDGAPKGEPQDVLTLDKFGIIKPRKLKFKEQNLEVETTEFNYNLVAQTEYESVLLSYKYNQQYNKWE